MMIDFQKQFDSVTGALNLFDLSYLISGAAMLGVLSYTYPEFRYFLVHKDNMIFSAIICVVAAYISGVICWVIGKRFRYLLLVLRKRNLKAVKKDFEKLFDEALSVCEIEERSKIKKMANRNKTLTYSYMWMKLDKTSHAPCKRRFDFISRFWTFRAIYEGLIPPFVLGAFLLYPSHFSTCFCDEKCICKVVEWDDLCDVFFFFFYFITIFCIVALLAMEARKCFKTQLREVVLAFSVFCSEDMRN